MKSQDAIRRMAEANPVPDVGYLHVETVDAERLFSSIERRRDEMIGTQTRPPPSPTPAPQLRAWYRSPAAVFLIAVAVVLVTAVPLAIFTGGGSDVAGAPAPTAPAPGVTTMPAPTTQPTTVPATTVPSEAPVAEPRFALEGWELITPSVDLGGASAAVFGRVVATDFGFVAIGGSVGDGIWTSRDGIEWIEVSDPSDPVGLGVGVDILDLAVNGNRIAAVIHNGWDAVTGVATSTDAENWTFAILSEASEMYPMSVVAYGTDGFIVSGTAIWLSTDGEHYELVQEQILQQLDPSDPGVRTSASDGHAVVLGSNVAELVVTQDGETWQLIPRLVGVDSEEQACSTYLSDLAYGPEGFVAVGTCGPYGIVWTSPDGFTWSQIPYDAAAFGEPAWLSSITASEHGYVAGGTAGGEENATVWASPDGIHWTRVVLEETVEVESGVLAVTIHENTVTAVGWHGGDAAVWRAALAG